MIPWIQVYSNLPQHPKTSDLADELGLTSSALNPNALAVGLLVSLWTWAIQNAYNGDLSGCSHRAIAEACLWKKKPETLVKALIKSGFLDEDMKLHDWEEYACLLVEQEENRRAKTRDRVKRYRDKKSAAASGNSNAPCNVTDTPCNAPTVPNLTIPDSTRPEDYLPTVDNLLSSGGGGSAGADGREGDAYLDFLRERGMEPFALLGMTPRIAASATAFANSIFATFATRRPTQADADNVLNAVYRTDYDSQTGACIGRIDVEAQKLLLYAFEAANNAGKPGDWNYIHGVLGKLSQRKIDSLAAADDYDLDRPFGGI